MYSSSGAEGTYTKETVLMDDKVTYRQQINFCGKPGCRKCRDGIGHGPYWNSYRVVDGRAVRTYIGKTLPPGVQVPASQKSPAVTDPAALRLAEMRDARKSLSSEIDELDRLLAADPTNEEALRRLMLALLQSKRRGEALRAYQRLASALRDRHKREPSAETRTVYEAIQYGEDVLGVQEVEPGMGQEGRRKRPHDDIEPEEQIGPGGMGQEGRRKRPHLSGTGTDGSQSIGMGQEGRRKRPHLSGTGTDGSQSIGMGQEGRRKPRHPRPYGRRERCRDWGMRQERNKRCRLGAVIKAHW